MTAQRFANRAIAEMDGTPALPRKSGELVFHNEWERRAFAIAVGLSEQGILEWSDFQPRLANAIATAEGNDSRNPSRGYYESWLTALESVLAERRLLPKG